jgi:hypothetical protein
MSMVARFDCYPSDFLNGIVGMTADQIATYTVVIMLQYDREGPVKLEGRERELATRAGLSQGKLRKAVSDLAQMGKIEIADGYVTNSRTVRELEKICRIFAKNRENSAKGGEAQSRIWEEKRLKSREEESRPASDRVADREPSRARLPSPSPLKDRDLKVSCPNGAIAPIRTRNAYPADFEEFWRAYPTDPLMSKKAAGKVWGRMGADERAEALASVSAFVRYCQSHPDYRPVHAERYLRDQRSEGFLKLQQSVAVSGYFAEHGTEEWRAWQQHCIETKGRGSPSTEKVINGRVSVGWLFPSKWPPSRTEEHVA